MFWKSVFKRRMTLRADAIITAVIGQAVNTGRYIVGGCFNVKIMMWQQIFRRLILTPSWMDLACTLCAFVGFV